MWRYGRAASKHGVVGCKSASAKAELYAVVVFVVGSGVYNLLAKY